MVSLTIASFIIMAFEGIWFILLFILEIIEDDFIEDDSLFWDSQYDKKRSFETLGNFVDLTHIYGFTLLCSAVFIACLGLWTWHNSSLEQSSRRDVEAERDDGLVETETYKDFESTELEKTGHQLAEIVRLQSEIAWTNAERLNFWEQLQKKNAELERLSAQHGNERKSQSTNIKALESAIDAQDNAMDADIIQENNAMEVDAVREHVYDHSQCLDRANVREGLIETLKASLIGRDIKIGRLESEAREQGMKMEGLIAQLTDQKAEIEKLQQSVRTSGSNANTNEMIKMHDTVSSLTAKLEDQDRKMSSLTRDTQNACRRANAKVKTTRDQLQAKEKELQEEQARRQSALEAERAIARQRFASSNPLQAELVGLKKALAEMTNNRDMCRVANETYRMQSFEARKAVEEGGRVQRMMEKQRDELVEVVEQLQRKMTNMVEAVRMEELEERSASRTRPNDGEHDTRSVKILPDE